MEVSHQVLRELRGLLTPAARRDVRPRMLDKNVTRKSFEEAIRDAQKVMWVNFHWTKENPNINPACRMRVLPPLPCWSLAGVPFFVVNELLGFWDGAIRNCNGGGICSVHGWRMAWHGMHAPKDCTFVAPGTDVPIVLCGEDLPLSVIPNIYTRARITCPLSPLAVSNERSKLRFSNTVTLGDLKVSVGRFRYSEATPRPTWEALKSAAVWQEPRFASLRTSLMSVPSAEQKVTGDEKVVTATLGGTKKTATLFDATTDEIPQTVATEVPRAMILTIVERSNLSPAVQKHLDTAPLLIYGPVSSVNSCLECIHDHTKQVTKINVYTRPSHHLPTNLKRLRKKLIAIVSNPGAVISQVPTHPPSPSRPHPLEIPHPLLPSPILSHPSPH